MADEDTRRLIPMTIRHLEDNLWEVSIENGETYKVEGDVDSIRKVLRRIKSKDGSEHGKCRSSKIGTYKSMFSDKDNNEHKINVWKSKIPHTADAFKSLMESTNMKTITLSKNYLVEGNIIPKGTKVQFVEKLDFLPADIWEKAKDISDKHERFEFIKAELNKLGDDYSDDEIEDFINKYKTELNESKKITKDDISDMLFLIEDTLKAEKDIDIDTKEDVLEKCENSKELLKAWDNLIKADDSKFNKLENKFWEIFDNLVAEFKLKNKKDYEKTA